MTSEPEIQHTVKGYWIARLDITDPEAYAEYRKRNAIAFAAFGGKFLVRGGPHHLVTGTPRENITSSSNFPATTPRLRVTARRNIRMPCNISNWDVTRTSSSSAVTMGRSRNRQRSKGQCRICG